MVANLDALSETVDLTRLDRKLADIIESQRARIDREIRDHGYSDVSLDGKTYRVTRPIAQGAAA